LLAVTLLPSPPIDRELNEALDCIAKEASAGKVKVRTRVVGYPSVKSTELKECF
jgi:hypothetical protein